MSDQDVIAWARATARCCAVTGEHGLGETHARLADLAEKGAEDWEPIATAQEDSHDDTTGVTTEILFCDRYGNRFIGWRAMGRTFQNQQERTATHWRPLPAPPGGER